MKEKLKHTIKIVTFFLVIKNSNRTSFYAIPHQQHQTVKQKKKNKTKPETQLCIKTRMGKNTLQSYVEHVSA